MKEAIQIILNSQREIGNKVSSDPGLVREIEEICTICCDAFRKGNKLMFCGNGGSAADAQHLAAEFSGRFKISRRGLPALALHANSSELTAMSNDFGYDKVYARAVEAHGKKGDVLFGISTSGRSQNVIEAMKMAKAEGIVVIGFCGENQEIFESLCDKIIAAPSDQVARIQEVHIQIGHIICELVEKELFG